MKVLCVAEKPSISKSITGILSGGQFSTRHTGTQWIKNYDFSYRLPSTPGYSDFTVTAVAGHLTEIHLPENTKGWQSCDPFTLFDAPVTRSVNADHKAIERNLLSEARHAQQIMIWTDCDREGEHIGAEIVSVCRRANPNIIVKRARFSAIIANQIHKACRNPVELDMRQAHAVDTRMELDLRVGAAMTRLQSLNLQAAFDELDGNVVSYGPCQFPTLGFVVEQYEKVQNFVPETFWYISVSLQREESSVEFSWRRNRLFDYEAALALHDMCIEAPEATVLSVATKPTSKWKPLPLTTVELQKSGSRLLHLTPKRILDVAESLYQKGFLSYPRTETDQFDPQFNFHELIEKHTNDEGWGAFATMLTNGGFERPRNGRKNDKAHPPIHPTAHVANLTGDDKRVYDLTSVWISIAGEHFSASGLVIFERNYLEIYPYDKWTGNHLPDFVIGEVFIPPICELKEGLTTRPNLLTEADLVNLMDKNAIGTDATIAEHISKVIDREYVMKRREGRTEYLVPSTLGIGLVEGYNDIGFEKSLSKPHLRRETEARMTAICEGNRSKREVLEETLEEYRDTFMRTRVDFARLVAAVGKYLQGNNDRPPAAGNDDQDDADGFLGGSDDNNDDDDGDPHPPAGNLAGRGRRVGRDRATASRSRGRGSQPPARPRRPRGGDDAGNQPGPPRGGGSVPSCVCKEPAVERTVFKEGPNKGRKFYSCSKPRDDGSCGFFEWVDETRATTRKRPYLPASPEQGRAVRSKPTLTGNHGVEEGMNRDGEIRCQCDLLASLKTVTKEGPNKARQFYTCSKVSKASQCKFFQWADEQENSLPGGQQRQSPARGHAGGAESKYSCFRCGEQGHFSVNCTNEGANARDNYGGAGAGRGDQGRGRRARGSGSRGKARGAFRGRGRGRGSRDAV